MSKPQFLAIALAILLACCHNNKQKSIQTAPAFKQGPLDSAYAAIRPAIQTYTIDNSKATTIKATNGTEILLPAGCLVTANGEPVTNAQLEIVEAFTLPGFVTSGLATISNGKLLLSNGMVYVNAKAGNENLQLKEGTSLTVSMPTMSKADGFQFFTGDGSNWTPDSSMMESDYIISVPIKLLYPEGNDWLRWSLTNDPDKNKLWTDSSINNFIESKYENTVIATEEFKERIEPLYWMMLKMSYLLNPNLFDGEDIVTIPNTDIYKVYFDHPERSLRESDSIAKKIYINYFKTNKEKLAVYCKGVNERYQKRHPEWADTIYTFDFRRNSLEEIFLHDTDWFTNQQHKPLKLINDRGVNLDAQDAVKQLVAKGVNTNEINEIMTYHFRRQAKINRLKNLKEAAVTQKKINAVYETTVFDMKKLGWVNCDRFYDDPEAGKAQIYVSDNWRNNLNYVDYSLVIPSLNVRLSAFPASNGKFTFTNSAGAYTTLPLGRDAVITAVSLQHDSLFYASRKIKIADGLNVALTLNYIKTNNLKDSLQAALSN